MCCYIIRLTQYMFPLGNSMWTGNSLWWKTQRTANTCYSTPLRQRKNKEYRAHKYTQVTNQHRRTCTNTNCSAHRDCHVSATDMMQHQEVPELDSIALQTRNIPPIKLQTPRSLRRSEVIDGGGGISLLTDVGSKTLVYSLIQRKPSCRYTPN